MASVEVPAAESVVNLVELFNDGDQKIERRRADNLFKQLDERQLTEDEQAIIQKRVELQRKMFQEYERREQQRKIRELLEVCPDLGEEGASKALELCNWREEETAVRVSSDPAFLRRVKGGWAACDAAPATAREPSKPRSSKAAVTGPRPKLVDPSQVGAVFVGKFKGRLGPHQISAMGRQQATAAAAAATSGAAPRAASTAAGARRSIRAVEAAADSSAETAAAKAPEETAAAAAVGSAQLEGSEGQQPEAEPEAARACSSPRAVDATAEAPDAMEVEAEEAGEPVSAGGEEPLGTEDGEGEGDGDGAEAAAEEEPNSADLSDNELQYEDDVLPVLSPLAQAAARRAQQGQQHGQEDQAADDDVGRQLAFRPVQEEQQPAAQEALGWAGPGAQTEAAAQEHHLGPSRNNSNSSGAQAGAEPQQPANDPGEVVQGALAGQAADVELDGLQAGPLPCNGQKARVEDDEVASPSADATATAMAELRPEQQQGADTATAATGPGAARDAEHHQLEQGGECSDAETVSLAAPPEQGQGAGAGEADAETCGAGARRGRRRRSTRLSISDLSEEDEAAAEADSSDDDFVGHGRKKRRTGGASRARGPPRKKAASRHQADTSAEEAATAPGPSAAARRRSGGLEGQAQEQQAAAGTTGRADEADAGASEEDAKPKRGRAAVGRSAGTGGAGGGGAAISASGHTCRGRVKQKGVKRAELLAVGDLITRAGWYNAGYIFPAGFKAQTLFRSSVDLDSLTLHTCEVLGEGGQYWPAPTFVVTAADRPDEPLVAKSCTGCWTAVLKRINSEIEGRRAAGEPLPPPPKTAIAGPEYFGLNQPEICAAIEALDTERACAAYWDGKMDREAVRGGQVVPPRARAATDAGAGAGGAGAAAAPRAASTRAPRAAGGKGRGGRRGGRADEDDTDEEAAGDEDAEATYAGNRWSAVTRRERYRKRCEDAGDAALLPDPEADNPLPGRLDPITLEPVVNPAISPYGHVMGLATWKAVLAEQKRCPFTKQPLTAEQLTVLTKNNIERYRSRIIDP